MLWDESHSAIRKVVGGVFCKNCGFRNDEGALYCTNDGAALLPFNVEVGLYRERAHYCNSCSHTIGSGDTYCQSCGQSVEKIKVNDSSFLASRSRVNRGSVEQSATTFFSKQRVIRTSMLTLLSIVIMLIISFVISSYMNNYVMDGLESYLGFRFEALKVVSSLDFLMLLHLSNFDFTLISDWFEGSLSTTSGLFLSLLVPAALFMVGGYCIGKGMEEYKNRFFHHLFLAGLYGVGIGLLSMIASGEVRIPIPDGLIGNIDIEKNYSFSKSVFNAFFISFVFMTVGSSLRLRKSSHPNSEKYGSSIKTAITHSVLGLLLMMVIGTVYMSTNEEMQLEGAFQKTLYGTQLGGYLWNIAQFGTLTFEENSFNESTESSYSLLGGSTASLEDEGIGVFIEESLGAMIWLLILIPLALHVRAGRKLRGASEGLLHALAVYSLVFGLVCAILVSITRLKVSSSFDEIFSFTLGFSTVGTFFICSLLAFCISALTVMFSNQKQMD